MKPGHLGHHPQHDRVLVDAGNDCWVKASHTGSTGPSSFTGRWVAPLCDWVEVDETLVGGRALWGQIAAQSAARDGQAALSLGASLLALRGSGWLS